MEQRYFEMKEKLVLTQEWYKTFPQSDRVVHSKGDPPQLLRHHSGR